MATPAPALVGLTNLLDTRRVIRHADVGLPILVSPDKAQQETRGLYTRSPARKVIIHGRLPHT